MNRKHLLWWVFHWLMTKHPDVLSSMLKDCDGDFGDGATSTVNKEMKAAWKRFEDAWIGAVRASGILDTPVSAVPTTASEAMLRMVKDARKE